MQGGDHARLSQWVPSPRQSSPDTTPATTAVKTTPGTSASGYGAWRLRRLLHLPRAIWERRKYVLWLVLYLAVVVAALTVGGWSWPWVGASPSPTQVPPQASLASSAMPSLALSPAPSITPTLVPVVAETLSGQLGRVNDADTHLMLAIVTLLMVIPGAVFLFVIAGYRFCRIALRQQLVISDMTDATGMGALKDQMCGLSQVLREGVYRALVDFRERYPSGGEARKALLPERSTSADLTAFVEGVKSSAPTQIGALLSALPALFPPAGLKIESYLSCATSGPLRLSLSVEIANVADGGGIVLDSLDGRSWTSPGSLPMDSNVDTEIPETAASYKAGLRLERAGRLDEAAKKYEAALVKDQACGEASQGLERLAEVPGALDQARGFALDSARWLTILLLRQQLIRPGSPLKPYRKDHRRARCHNLLGVELLRLAGSARVADPKLLYLEAIEEFKQAEAWDPSWYQPAVNLGDALSYLGVLGKTTLVTYEWDALRQYDLALKCLDNPSVLPQIMEHLPWLGIRRKNEEAKRRTDLSRAITQLYVGRANDIAASVEAIVKYTSDPKLLAYQENLTAGRTLHRATSVADLCRALGGTEEVLGERAIANLYAERKAETLYTAACWWAVVAKIGKDQGCEPTDEVRHAARYLALALACEPDLATGAVMDPDFESMIEVVSRVVEAVGWLSLPKPDDTRSIEDFAEQVVDYCWEPLMPSQVGSSPPSVAEDAEDGVWE